MNNGQPRGHFSFAPVQFELEARFTEIDCVDDRGMPYVLAAGDAGRASTLLGYNRKTIGDWRRGRLLTVDAAEACAHALGSHPSSLWLDYHDICARIDADRQAAHQRMLAKQRVQSKAWRQKQTSAA